MQQRRFTAGETIFQEGDPSDFAYLIWSGRVEVVKCQADSAAALESLGRVWVRLDPCGNDFMGANQIVSSNGA